MVHPESPYLLQKEGKKVKSLGATELAVLRGFVRDVLRTCEEDDTMVTADIYDSALQAAEILGIVWAPIDKTEDEFEGYKYEKDPWKDDNE